MTKNSTSYKKGVPKPADVDRTKCNICKHTDKSEIEALIYEGETQSNVIKMFKENRLRLQKSTFRKHFQYHIDDPSKDYTKSIKKLATDNMRLPEEETTSIFNLADHLIDKLVNVETVNLNEDLKVTDRLIKLMELKNKTVVTNVRINEKDTKKTVKGERDIAQALKELRNKD